MLKIYGTLRCPDCVECLDVLDEAAVAYEFLDFDKDFLKIRDHSDRFDGVREAGSIGIPCLVEDNGNITLDWKTVM